MDATRLLRLAREAAPAGAEPLDTELLRRYATERDEGAFTELVRRNGPVVLRACRNVLGEVGAEDAFQATFLLLVRSAGRLTRPGALAGWLHAAAVRIARRARRGESRRRSRELRSAPKVNAPDDLTWREVREVLDTELAALPEKYRVPLVLCYLQELSYEEAARRVGCPVGTLRGRLERGKERLRRRLARYELPLVAPVLVLGAPTQVPAALVRSTLATVGIAMNEGHSPAFVGELAGLRTGIRAALLVPTVVALAVVAGVLMAGARPAAEPPPQPMREIAQPDRRTDRFGDPLPDGVLARLGTVRSRAGIHSFAPLPDGTVVTVGPNLDVRTWDPKSDQPGPPVLLPLQKPAPYLFPQISADGRFVAAGTAAKVLVWERAAEVTLVASFEVKNARRLALAPDGGRLAVAYERDRHEERVALCDVRTGAVRELERGAHAEVLCFSGNGQRLLAGSWERAVVWDAPTGRLLADHKGKAVLGIPGALSPTGSVIAVLPYQHGKDRVSFLDTTTGKAAAGLTGPEVSGDWFVTFAPDGKSVLLGGPSGVRWWDPTAGTLIRRFDAPSSVGGFVRPLARLTPDGKVLVSHTRQALFRWDAATARPLFPASQETGHTEGVAAVGISPDGSRVATLGNEVGVRVWDPGTGRQLAVLPASRMNQNNLDFSPDGRFLFAPSKNCDAVVKWDLETGREVSRCATGVSTPWGGSLKGFRLAPDGQTVRAVIRLADNTSEQIVDWDAGSGRVLSKKAVTGRGPHQLSHGTFSPDALWLACDGTLFPVTAGPGADTLAATKIRELERGEFSWDSRLFAVVTSSGPPERVCRAVVLEVATGAPVFEAPVRWVTGVAFHPDGRSLAGAESDGLVFWDLATRKAYARRKAHAEHLNDPLPFAQVLRYFPDGKKLVTGHIDTTALVWEAPARPKAPKALDEKGRAAAWADLVSPDGARGWAAVWALADDPGAVAFLRARVHPVAPLPEREFNRLLSDLGADTFATREAASSALTEAGESAVAQLRSALRGELTAEQKARIDRLLAGWSGATQKPPTGAPQNGSSGRRPGALGHGGGPEGVDRAGSGHGRCDGHSRGAVGAGPDASRPVRAARCVSYRS